MKFLNLGFSYLIIYKLYIYIYIYNYMKLYKFIYKITLLLHYYLLLTKMSNIIFLSQV
jgi:hypothetical protein